VASSVTFEVIEGSEISSGIDLLDGRRYCSFLLWLDLWTGEVGLLSGWSVDIFGVRVRRRWASLALLSAECLKGFSGSFFGVPLSVGLRGGSSGLISGGGDEDTYLLRPWCHFIALNDAS
jgi:hypothetical protein